MDNRGSEIKPLGEESIRRIVAEQAITDLSSIAKELVDNALDAESNTIKVRLFGQGMDIIEVSDDGTGVPIPSRAHLATRYATSKIQTFEDIYSGTGLTMGFRGEALFSMACLSEKLIIATRTESDEMAQELEFQRDGTLNENSVQYRHRKVGTTVAVVKPFHALPARRADMERRIKSERGKLVRLMESYAIFNVGITFNVIDCAKGESVLLATSSSSTRLEETISAVMGHKFLKTLAPIELNLDKTLNNTDSGSITWEVRGMISANPRAPMPGKIINIYTINGRVVDLPKVTALLRKIWTSFGGTKRPSCILAFSLPNDKFDINLAPDKQQVLLTDENEIFGVIQEYVTTYYSNQVNGVFQAQSIDLQTQEEDLEGKRQTHRRRSAFVHDFSKALMQHDLEERQSFQENEESKIDLNSEDEKKVETNEEPPSKKMKGTHDNGDYSTDDVRFHSAERVSDMERRKWTDIQMTFQKNEENVNLQSMVQNNDSEISDEGKESFQNSSPKENDVDEEESQAESDEPTGQKKRTRQLQEKTQSQSTLRTFLRESVKTRKPRLSSSQEAIESSVASSSEESEGEDSEEVETTEVAKDSPTDTEPPPLPTIWSSFKGTEFISCSARQERLQMCQRKRKEVEQGNVLGSLSFIQNDEDNGPGEENADGISNSIGSQEFSTGNVVKISKEEFRSNMKVLGQFNLGFILCLSKNNNLWIFDQHACDEKYNFESLCRNTKLHEQKLLRPMPLELSPSEEACILDHRDIFEANGFHFEFKSEAPIRHRLFLTTLPHSGAESGRNAVQFGKDDVRALCAMLSDGSSYDAGDGGTGTDGSGMHGNNAVRRYASQSTQPDKLTRLVTRLPKAIAMFASRACRSSIMIGTALSKNEMEKVVSRLADVEHPWNCPHGRPTLRHVGNVLQCMLQDERRAASHITNPTLAVAPMTQASSSEDD